MDLFERVKRQTVQNKYSGCSLQKIYWKKKQKKTQHRADIVFVFI